MANNSILYLNIKAVSNTGTHAGIDRGGVVQEWIQEFALGGALSLPSSSSPLPSCPLTFPPLGSRAPLNQLGGLRESCKLSQRGLGRSHGRKRIWSLKKLSESHWLQTFQYFEVDNFF